MALKITGIIPSRYASSRFPGKPLIDIDGKTMIRRVYEQALLAKSLSEVIVATDDERIFNEVKGFGGNVQITSSAHKNGTERCAEIAAKSNADIVINIQGDEPFIHPQQIDLLAACFTGANETQIATLIKLHPLNEDLQSPARIKVVVNNKMEALYFSRSTIPFLQNNLHVSVHGFQTNNATKQEVTEPLLPAQPHFYKHIGIYGYRKKVLMEIVKLEESLLEKAEALEQLRWLQNGYTIQCAITEHESISIDIPEDLKALRNMQK